MPMKALISQNGSLKTQSRKRTGASQTDVSRANKKEGMGPIASRGINNI